LGSAVREARVVHSGRPPHRHLGARAFARRRQEQFVKRSIVRAFVAYASAAVTLAAVGAAPASAQPYGVLAAIPSGAPIALRTYDGHYVSDVGGGGHEGQPDCGFRAVALHDNASEIGPAERFRVTRVPGTNRFALQTADGEFLTAVNGGGIGGPPDARGFSQLHTNAENIGPWERFHLVKLGGGEIALRTPDGYHYVSAANTGGCGGPNDVPFHTDAETLGPWEQFAIVALP